MTFKKALKWNMEIEASANGGYLMDIGCQQFAYGPNDVSLLIADITEYLKDPAGVEEQYRATSEKEVGSITYTWTPVSASGVSVGGEPTKGENT